MKLHYEEAPAGSLCNRDTDLAATEDTPCGNPAVTVIVIEDSLSDHKLFLCEDCRIERLRRQVQDEQHEAFEAQHGYPPDRDMLDLSYSLGMTWLRYEKLLEQQAPPVIIENEGRMIARRDGRVLAWLRHHEPVGYDTHVAAIDAVIAGVTKDYDAHTSESTSRQAVFAGLKRARTLCSTVDKERRERS